MFYKPNQIIFKQQVYKTRIENGNLYINTPLALSLAKSDSFEAKVTSSRTNSTKLDTLSSESASIETKQDEETKTLSYWALKILNTAEPHEKAELTDRVAEMWANNELTGGFGSSLPPDHPKRLDSLNIVDPAKIRRGKAGTMVKK